jgi:putative oxidoreductase
VVLGGAAGAAETLGGVMLRTAVAPPAATAMVSGTMTTAIERVHWEKGIWNTDGGFEYNAVLVAAATVIADEDDGPAWALAGLAAGVIGGLVVAKVIAPRPAPEQEEEAPRFQRDEQPVATESTAG